MYGVITFEFRGVTHVRHCPTEVYYETLLKIAAQYPDSFMNARGSRDRPRSLPLPQAVPRVETIVALSRSQ
jgi:hypothetical protein